MKNTNSAATPKATSATVGSGTARSPTPPTAVLPVIVSSFNTDADVPLLTMKTPAPLSVTAASTDDAASAGARRTPRAALSAIVLPVIWGAAAFGNRKYAAADRVSAIAGIGATPHARPANDRVAPGSGCHSR